MQVKQCSDQIILLYYTTSGDRKAAYAYVDKDLWYGAAYSMATNTWQP